MVLGSRASLAEPPAELPSTMNSSHSSRLVDVQSTSLPGSPAPSRADLRLVASRAWRAAKRAFWAWRHLVTILRASEGFSSSHSASFSLVARSTSERIDAFPSFALVWPSNCGSRSLTLTIAVSPSRMSSPARLSSFSLRCPLARQ